MFKNETLVQVAVFTLTLLLSSAQAADVVPPAPGARDAGLNFGRNNCSTMMEQYNTPEKRKELAREIFAHISDEGARLAALWSRFCKDEGAPEDECRNAKRDFTKAKEEMQCVGFPQGSDVPGNIMCAHAIEKCNCMSGGGSGDTSRPLCQNVSSRPSAAERYAMCPAEAAKGIDKLENDIRDQRRLLSEAQKRQQEGQKNQNQADKGAGEALKAVRDGQLQAAKQHAEKMKEAKRAQEDAQNQLAQQLLQFEEQIAEIEDRRGALSMQRHQAKLKYDQTIMQIELQCHASALSQVTEEQKQQQAEVQANIHNRGGFGHMMKNVGRTDRDRWQERAKMLHRRCLRSQPTRDTKKAAAKQLKAEYLEADKQEWKVNADRRAVERRMNKIRNGNVCGNQDGTQANGETAETGMCQARRRAIEDARQSAALYAAEQAKLRQDAAAAMADAAKQRAQDQANVARDTGDVAREQGRLAELENELALKKRYSNGVRIDDKQFADALSKYAKMKGAAVNLVDCQTEVLKRKGQRPDCAAGECRQALELLYSVGSKSQDEYERIIRESGGTVEPGARDGRRNVDNPDAEATPEN